jgi:branched-chain amino acid transport system substrate-binding protein
MMVISEPRGGARRGHPLRGHRLRGPVVAATCLLALVAAACSSGSGSGSGSGGSKSPITIGVSVSLSGDFSADGLATEQGYKTWAAYQNAHGGILGRQIKLEFLSDASSPTQVNTNYQKLITTDHVDFILGPYSTLLTQPSSVIANRYGKVMLEGIGGGPSVFHQGLHNVFDVSASAAYQLISFAKWLPSAYPKQKVAYATMDDPFIKPMVDGAKAYMEAHGNPTAVYKVYPLETTDYSPIVSAIADSGAKIVVLGTMPPDGEAFIQQLIQAKDSPTVLVEASGPDQGATFVKAIGAKNDEGIMVPNTWYPGAQFKSNQAMIKQYMKLFGSSVQHNPDNISADVPEAYSAGQVLAAAIDHVGTLDNSKVQSYLHSGATFQTVQGPVRFKADGENVAATPFVFQWQHQKLVPVLPLGMPGVKPIEKAKPAWGASPTS